MKKSLVLLTAAIALMTMNSIVQADAGTFQAAGTFTINGVPTAPPPTRIVVQGPKTVKLDPEDRARLDALVARVDTSNKVLARIEQAQVAQSAKPDLGRDIVAAIKKNGDWLKWLLAATGILILLTLLSMLQKRTVSVVSQSRRDDDPGRTVQLGKETTRVEPKPAPPSGPAPTPVPATAPEPPAPAIVAEPPTPPVPAASPAVVPVGDSKVVTIQIPSDVFERVMEKHFPGAGAKLASSVAPATPPSPPPSGPRPPRRDRNRGPKTAGRA